MTASPRRAPSAPFGSKLARDRAADEPHDAVDEGIVGCAVETRERQAALARTHGGELPIAEVGREEDAGLAVVAQPVDVLGTDHLHARAGLVEAEPAEMGILAHDAAEVVPHGEENAADLGLRFFRKRAPQIVARLTRDGKIRPYPPAEPAAQARRRIEGYQAEEGEGERHLERLEPVAEVEKGPSDAGARLSHGG